MRKCHRSLRPLAALIAATGAVSLPALALADTPVTQFQPGDYFIMRGGDATNTNGTTGVDYNGETTAFIDEYSQAGYYVGTVPLPQMTLPGANVSSHEGQINISPNGQWISFGGYDPVQNAPGTVAHNTDGTENDVIGDINIASGPSSLNMTATVPGTGNTGTSITGQAIHAVLTLDGNEFWVAGKYNASALGALQTSGTGLYYVSGAGPTTGHTTVLEGGTDWRNVLDFGGQLYGGTGSSSVGDHGLYEIGTGMPTTNSPIPGHVELTSFPGGNSVTSFGFVNIPTSDTAAGTFNGYNVVYTVGDEDLAGITKYYYDPIGQVWDAAGSTRDSLNANNVTQPEDIVAAVDPTNPAWVDLTISGENGIYSYVDKSGDPEAAIPQNSFAQPITPSSYASFYGMTQDPGPANLVWGQAGNGQTWNVGTTANWNYAGANTKFANGENVTFDDSSNNTQSISLSSIVQPGSVTVNASVINYTITGSGSIGGSGILRLLPGNTSTFTLGTANTYTGGTIVNGGKLVVAVNNAIPGSSALSIGAAGTVQLATGTGLANLSSLTVAAGGTFDITNNHVYITDGSGIATTIIADLKQGHASNWAGPGGIVSTTASANLTYGVAFGEGGIIAGLPAGKIEISYTLYGDINQDGAVNGTDFGILAANFGKSVTGGWQNGDLNYDGAVTGADFALLAANFGKSASGRSVDLPASEWEALDSFAASHGLLADVPEPSAFGLLAIAGCSVLARRRKAASGPLECEK